MLLYLAIPAYVILLSRLQLVFVSEQKTKARTTASAKKDNNKKNSDYSFYYTVEPTNFLSLPLAKQQEKIGGYFDLLRSIETPIRITFSRKDLPVLIDGQTVLKPVLQVLVASREPLNGMFEHLQYEHSVDEPHKRLEVTDESLNHLAVKSSLFGDSTKLHAKCFALHDLPAELPWGWIHQVFSACHEINVYISPIDRDQALTSMRRKQSMLLKKAQTLLSAREEYSKVTKTERSLANGGTKHYSLAVTCTVLGDSSRNLKGNVKEFRKNMRVVGGSFDDIISKHGQMYFGLWQNYLTVDLAFLSITYPFVSADMLEQPNGVILGINTDSGAPIIYDIAKRINGNVAIVGTSGSGKSFTSKLFVKRLLERMFGDNSNNNDNNNNLQTTEQSQQQQRQQRQPEKEKEKELCEIDKTIDEMGIKEDEEEEYAPACFILDPMDEYYKQKEYFGLDGLRITGEEELGIDPFKTLPPADAASVLARFTKVDEIDITVANEFQRHADDVKSVEELYAKVSENAKQYLVHLVEGPLRRIMKGDPKISDNIIISLNGANGKDHEILMLLLLLNKIWKRVFEMPIKRQKIIVVDEGWLLFKMRGAIDYIDQIVRMGRKLNVKFVFISQKIDDLVNDKGAEGRMIDNIATKILMKLDDDAAVRAQQVLRLSDEEVARITKFSPGQGLILTEKHRIMAKLEARKEETLTYFNTTPTTEE